MNVLISIVVEQPCWQGASLHFRHLDASLTASYIVMSGMSLSQLSFLVAPWQWGVLSNSSEYFSLILVFLKVGWDIWVGMLAITSLAISGENEDRDFFFEPHPPSVAHPPPVPHEPKDVAEARR
jgi:hypothetical protein